MCPQCCLWLRLGKEHDWGEYLLCCDYCCGLFNGEYNDDGDASGPCCPRCWCWGGVAGSLFKRHIMVILWSRWSVSFWFTMNMIMKQWESCRPWFQVCYIDPVNMAEDRGKLLKARWSHIDDAGGWGRKICCRYNFQCDCKVCSLPPEQLQNNDKVKREASCASYLAGAELKGSEGNPWFGKQPWGRVQGSACQGSEVRNSCEMELRNC